MYFLSENKCINAVIISQIYEHAAHSILNAYKTCSNAFVFGLVARLDSDKVPVYLLAGTEQNTCFNINTNNNEVKICYWKCPAM